MDFIVSRILSLESGLREPSAGCHLLQRGYGIALTFGASAALPDAFLRNAWPEISPLHPSPTP